MDSYTLTRLLTIITLAQCSAGGILAVSKHTGMTSKWTVHVLLQ